MAIKYRNVRNGHVVSVPEPKEAEKAAPNEYVGRKDAVHARRTIQRMDDSKRWQRVDSDTAEPATSPEPADEPTSDDESEPKADGIHNVGGGWHEVVVKGEVVDKVRGAEAAQETYEARSRW